MHVKTLSDKILETIDKGTVSLALPPKIEGPLSEFGSVSFSEDGISVRSSGSHSSSEYSRDWDDDEEFISAGSCAINIAKLKSMLSSTKKGTPVEIRLNEKEASGEAIGVLECEAGKSSWRMPCVHSDIVADVRPDNGKLMLEATKKDLVMAISSVSYAANIRDAFFTNSNICFSVNGDKLLMGATDDIRCAVYELKLENQYEDSRFLAPVVCVSPALKSFNEGPMSIFVGDKSVRLEQHGHQVRFSLPDAADVNRFPKYEAAVLANYPYSTRVLVSAFAEAISACQKMNKEEFLLRYKDDVMDLYAYDSKDGMSYKSEVGYTGDNISVSVEICSMFLIEFIKKVSGDVVNIEFRENEGKQKVIKISDESGRTYIMKSLVDMICVPPDSIEV